MSYRDWEAVFNNDSLPLSCCKTSIGTIGTLNCSALSPANVYPEGCEWAFGQYVRDHAVVIGGTGIGIAFIQVNKLLIIL